MIGFGGGWSFIDSQYYLRFSFLSKGGSLGICCFVWIDIRENQRLLRCHYFNAYLKFTQSSRALLSIDLFFKELIISERSLEKCIAFFLRTLEINCSFYNLLRQVPSADMRSQITEVSFCESISATARFLSPAPDESVESHVRCSSCYSQDKSQMKLARQPPLLLLLVFWLNSSATETRHSLFCTLKDKRMWVVVITEWLN